MNEPIKINYNGKTYFGYKKLPKWLRQSYLKAVDYKCEKCPNKQNLEIHRWTRGIDNGLYIAVYKGHPLCNWEVLCKNCHSIRNYSRKLNYQYSIKK